MPSNEFEQTLILIKPDALKNSLTGYILSTLSEFHTGLHFAGAKVLHVHKMLAKEHYDEHREKIFFPALLEYIMGHDHYISNAWKQRVIAIVYQGPDAVKKLRHIAGPTNPLDAREEQPGCIRALGTIFPIKDKEGNQIGQRLDNLIHASATLQEAEREIKLWFKPNEIPPAMHAYPTVICDEYFYYKDNTLFTDRQRDSICILAPQDMAWESDLDTLQKISQGKTAAQSLESAVAKYLINEKRIIE